MSGDKQYFEPESRIYSFCYEVTEDNLSRIDEFLRGISTDKNYNIKYLVNFDNENQHSITREKISDIVGESDARQSPDY